MTKFAFAAGSGAPTIDAIVGAINVVVDAAGSEAVGKDTDEDAVDAVVDENDADEGVSLVRDVSATVVVDASIRAEVIFVDTAVKESGRPEVRSVFSTSPIRAFIAFIALRSCSIVTAPSVVRGILA